jgi:hypothetical protein
MGTQNLLKHGVHGLPAAIHSDGERLRLVGACPKRDWRKAVLDKTELQALQPSGDDENIPTSANQLILFDF